MTLWKFFGRINRPFPAPVEAVELVNSLSNGMKDFPGELPALRIWERTCESAARLRDNPDNRVQTLLRLIWIDFEDVSLMPAYWDLASFVCILALFRGVQEPTLMYVLDNIDHETDLKSFGFTLIARTLMSTLGNLDYGLMGHGDLDFALKELGLAEDFIHQIDSMNGGVIDSI